MITSSKEELQYLYVDQKFTMEQIAFKFNTNKSCVFKLLKKYQIESLHGRNLINPPSKELLIDLHINQFKEMIEIAKIYKVNRATVRKWFKDYEIVSRKRTDPKPIPPKEELETLYIYMKKTMNEIGIIYKVDRSLVTKWFSNYNIEIITPEKQILEDFYKVDNLTLKQIGGFYGVSRETVARWFRYYNIIINSNQRKFYHLRAVPLTNYQKEFIYGTMLGDGFIHKSGKKSLSRLVMTHSDEQLGYLLWKKRIMSNFVNTVYRKEQIARNSVCWSWTSICHNELNYFHSFFYNNNKKYINKDIIHHLTPFAMAIWMMDDGSLCRECNMRISSDSFTKEEHEILQNAIKVNFDINCKILEYNRNNKKYYYISFNKRNSILLTKLIKPYFIESFNYKLIDLDSITDPQRPHAENS